MNEYKINELALFLGTLIAVNRDLNTSDSLKQPIFTDAFCEALCLQLKGVAAVCQNFDADPSLLAEIATLERELGDRTVDRREAVLASRINAIINGIENNLSSRKFMYVPPDQAAYWNNLKMFGDHFVLAFPQRATSEMLEAGKCFAVARGTACVFHCMRVAEYGLRKLARILKVTITNKGKRCPLEYGDWDTVITAIKNKITETRRFPRGPKKERALQFYSNAADHCEYMKDIWRNEIAHTRRFYNKAETLAVISRVSSFVQLFEMSQKDANKELKKRLQRIQQLSQANGATGERAP